MDEFLRKKILYLLKHEFDGDPYKIVDLAGQFTVETNVLERNVLYLAQQGGRQRLLIQSEMLF